MMETTILNKDRLFAIIRDKFRERTKMDSVQLQQCFKIIGKNNNININFKSFIHFNEQNCFS